MKAILMAAAALATLAIPAAAGQPRGYRGKVIFRNRTGHTLSAVIEGRRYDDDGLEFAGAFFVPDGGTLKITGLRENLACEAFLDADLDGAIDYSVPFPMIRTGRVTLFP